MNRQLLQCSGASSLFVLGSLRLGLVPGPLLPLASVALVGALGTQLAESTALDGCGHVGLLDLGDGLVDAGNGESGTGGGDALGGGLELLLGRVALLGLVALLGEQDQAGGVGLEALDVGGEGLLGQVLAAGIDGDTDSGSVLAGDTGSLQILFHQSIVLPTNDLPLCCLFVCSRGRTFFTVSKFPISGFAVADEGCVFGGLSYLQLSQGETTASTDTTVVLDARASHNRSELVDRTGGKGGSLSLASNTSRGLLAGLYSKNFKSDSIRTIAKNCCPLTLRNTCPPLPCAFDFLSSGMGSPYFESVPGRSGIEPGVASPFGSLIAVSVSISG